MEWHESLVGKNQEKKGLVAKTQCVGIGLKALGTKLMLLNSLSWNIDKNTGDRQWI